MSQPSPSSDHRKASTALDSGARKRLRGEAQRLQPAVHVGKAGAGAAQLAEIDRALARDGLIKLRFQSTDHAALRAALDAICAATGAQDVGQTGHTAAIWRERRD
jgi:RNA-binding protein